MLLDLFDGSLDLIYTLSRLYNVNKKLKSAPIAEKRSESVISFPVIRRIAGEATFREIFFFNDD